MISRLELDGVRLPPAGTGTWLAIGEEADDILAGVVAHETVADVHEALARVPPDDLVAAAIEADALAARPAAGLRQLSAHLPGVVLVVIARGRSRRVEDAARETGAHVLAPDALARALAGPRQPAAVPRADGDRPRPPRRPRAPAAPEAGSFASGCLARLGEVDALRTYVVEQLAEASGAGRVSLMQHERGHRRLRLVAAQGLPDGLVDRVLCPLGRGVAGRAAALGRPVTGHGSRGGAHGYDGRAYAVLPLPPRAGVLSLTDFPNDALPASRILRHWASLARIAGRALRSAERMARMEALSREDRLTGLPNRRTFERALDRELQRATRSGLGLGLVLFDIDHFKAINDEHGHAAGDEVLKVVARRLRDAFRDSDLVTRWGGEEFAVLLPDVHPADDAQAAPDLAAAERGRRAVRGRPIALGDGGPPLTVTISAGLARWPHDARDARRLLEAADGALYRAKRGGRDQVLRAEAGDGRAAGA